MGLAKLLTACGTTGFKLHSFKGGFSRVGSCRYYANGSPESLDSSSGESDEESSGSKVDEVKNRILAAALDHVPEQGWTHRSIAAGADSVGYPGVSHGMFPRGGIELVDHFYVKCNEKLAEELSDSPAPTRRTRSYEDFLQNALETRLRMILPYVGTWTQAMSLMALPENIPDATRNLWVLVDDVWHYAGDRSTDFSWYTKRAGLAAVYVSTELALVQDNSADHVDTWAFLNRRIKQLETANQRFAQKQAFAEGLPGFLESSAITLKNMLGLRNFAFRSRTTDICSIQDDKTTHR